METDRKVLQLGAAVILCALIFRLGSYGVMETNSKPVNVQSLARAILYLETGRSARMPEIAPASPTEQTRPEGEETAKTPEILPEKPKPIQFSAADAELVSVRNTSSYEVSTEAALLTPLTWELTGEEPTVLILHTHGSESYVNNEGYDQDTLYRTLDTRYNVVSLGDYLAALLEEQGIAVLHDRTLHDYPSYSGSYGNSREAVQAYLEAYPTIRLVLDLHRDAITDSAGNQVGYTLETEKGTAAKLMLVMGTGSGGLHHPNWQENFALSVKLQAQLEKTQPGICRELNLRPSRYNQDLMTGMVLVEMGAAGNTRQETLVAVEILAETIATLAHGTA